MANEKAKNKIENLPEGRLINYALFKRDVYKDPDTGAEGKPMYKAEVAIPRKYNNTLMELIADAAYERFGEDGEDAVHDGDIRLPMLDGDELADDRESRGKSGDAYRGCVVVRPNTAFNAQGDEGPGGIDVFDEEVEPLHPEDDGKLIYAGCKVVPRVAVAFFPLTDKRDKKDYPFGYGCKFYLVAVQKTGDGEQLATGADNSKAFSKVGGGTKRKRHEEDEEEEAPRRSKRRREEPEDEEDEAPRRSKRRRKEPEDDEDEDDDPKPRRRR